MDLHDKSWTSVNTHPISFIFGHVHTARNLAIFMGICLFDEHSK